MTAVDPDDARLAALRERARRIAVPEEAAASADRLEALVFQLAWENYAIETGFIREIFPLRNLTPIPCTPAHVLGVINVRGEICTVVDLKRLLGLPEPGLSNATNAVILNDAAMEFAIVADVIVGVRTFEASEIGPPPATFSGINAAFLKGVATDRTVVLDAGGVIRHPAIVVNQKVED